MTLTDEQLDSRRERHAPVWYWLLSGALMAFSVFSVIRSRTWEDIITRTIPIALAVGAVLFVVLVAVLVSERRRITPAAVMSSLIPGILVAFGLVVVAGFFGFFLYAIGATLHDYYSFSRGDLLGEAGLSVLRLPFWTLVVLVISVVLYALRKNRRACYGLSEAAVGLLVAGQNLAEAGPLFSGAAQRAANNSAALTASQLAIPLLTAGVYLVVQGLENVQAGLEEPPIDPWATKLVKWLTKTWSP